MTALAAIQFDSHYFWDHLFHPQSFFLRAIWTTVYVAVLGQAFGTLLGLPIAMARRSTNRFLVAFAWFYSWLWRGTPLLVQLLIIYTGVATANLYHWGDWKIGPIYLPGAVQAAILTLALAEAADMSGNFRAAIGSLEPGQRGGGKAFGMGARRAEGP